MSSPAVDRFCAKLHGLKRVGDGWLARCPAHEDTHQSLKIDEAPDGRVLVFCHAGCSPGAILAVLDLTFTDLFPPDVRETRITATYPYYDANGTLLYEAVRYVPKGFKQRRPDPQRAGGWLWNLIGTPRVPYKLPELQGQPRVVIVEGEKDVETLWARDIPATCNAGGSQKWKRAETEALKKAGCQRVIILPDHDGPGRKHADQVAALCKAAGLAVSVTELPGLGPHGDVSDWLAAGHATADLLALFDKPYLVPASGLPLNVPPAGPAVEAGPDPGGWKRTDLGNAEAFLAHFGDLVRWDRAEAAWLVWRGHTWQRDADADVRCLAHDHVRRWQHEAVGITDYVKRSSLLTYLDKLERSGSFDAMLKEARVKPTITVRGGWDEAPWLLGTPNGIVDLTTGTHRAGRPEDRITKTTGVPYDPDARCPRWEQFLTEVFNADASLVAYVQRAIGYCLTGITSEQCFFLAFGTGANGKSTFLVTLDTVLGDYAHTTDIRTFTHTGDGVHYEVAELAGRRLITTSETKTRSQLNEQVIKNFTGGERIEAQKKYGDPFTFVPVGKLWFAVNHQPKVSDESLGFWRRVRLVPFTQTFTGGTEDRTLGEKLKAEGSGILRWALEGVRLWREQGLQPPDSVVAATEAYQAAEDPVVDFLQEACLIGANYRVQASVLYKRYATWSRDNGLGEDTLTGTMFGRRIGKHFDAEKNVRGKFYLGVTVREADSLYPD